MRAAGTMAMAALSVPLLCWPVAGHAQRSESVKELMGRAQSESERRAVEDLINKLQGRSAPPKSAPAEQAAPPPVPPPAAAKAAPAPVPVAPVEPPKSSVAAPAQPTPAPPSPVNPATSATPATEPPPAAPAAAQPPPAASTPIPAASPAPPPPPPPQTAAPKEPPAPARPAAVAPTPAPAAPAGKAAASAEREQPPTVDLEIFFEFASAKLTPQATATLVTLGRTLTDPRLADQVFIIGGFTDAKGKPDYNLWLSQLRAESVRQFLITEFRIDAKRLIAKGYGATQLKNAAHRDADENRRVRIINWTSQLKR